MNEETDKIEETSIDEKINTLFHRLWTKATYAKNYDKKEWMKFQQLLNLKGIVT